MYSSSMAHTCQVRAGLHCEPFARDAAERSEDVVRLQDVVATQSSNLRLF